MKNDKRGRNKNQNKTPKANNRSNNNCDKPNNGDRQRRNGGKETEINVKDSDINLSDLGIRGKHSRDNDVAWYAKNEALLRDSASFAYGVPLGTKINTTIQANLSQFGGTNYTISPSIRTIPGVCAVHFVPTIGMSDDTYSAANLAARNIYSFVRHANSGSANYDSPDLMMYLLATDSCFSFYAMMVRAYGVMQTYSATNRYMPKALINAMGLDFENLMQNLPQFRYFINQYALKLGSLCVPGDMSYIERHIWMNSNVYTDSQSWKAQMYLYIQDAYYTFVEQTTGPGYLQYTEWFNTSNSLLQLASIISFANSLVEPLLASEDIGIMSGDILKAFGRDNLFYVNMIAEDYSVVPGYSAEVLSQIENATILGTPSSGTLSTYTRNIIQDVTGPTAGAIRQHFFWEYTNTVADAGFRGKIGVLAFPRILNMHKDDVSAGETMVASRLTNVVTSLGYSDDSSNPSCVWEVEQCGSEIVTAVTLLTIDPGNALYTANINYYGNLASTVGTNIYQCILSVFDWAPQIAILRGTGGESIQLLGYSTDFDNYVVLTSNDVIRMHDAALLSEFDVPQMARLSTRPNNAR